MLLERQLSLIFEDIGAKEVVIIIIIIIKFHKTNCGFPEY